VICGLRLWHLAEGNPDEEKIGAFGVGQLPVSCCDVSFDTLIPWTGFYSLFSVTEEPMVTSGGQHSSFMHNIFFKNANRPMDGLLLEG
jgi:hypothetical protein